MKKLPLIMLLAFATQAVACGGGDSSSDADGDGVESPDGNGGADTSGEANGLGCTCAVSSDCGAGFCSNLFVCTTSELIECTQDADCDCGARCVVVGDSQSCQVPCQQTSDCPGSLQCAPLAEPWTTTAGDTFADGCLAPAAGGPVTWDADIQPIVAAACANCHLGRSSAQGSAQPGRIT